MEKKLLGRWGEEKAAQFLKKAGYRVVGLNYRCRMGEIDIIAQNRKYVVFVEVKLRKSPDFARASEYVTAAKRQRIRTTAAIWLSQNETGLQPRFDVLEIYAPQGVESEKITINHIENAFE